MARYQYLNNRNARDTETGDWVDVVERSAWYVHRAKNILAVKYNGSELHFTPQVHLTDVSETDDEFSRPRRIALKFGHLEDGRTYPVVVAVQASLESTEYIDCIVGEKL